MPPEPTSTSAPEPVISTPPATDLPIGSLDTPPADTPDFMSAIDKAFSDAEKGTTTPETPKVDDKKTVEKKEPVADPTKVVSPKAADFAKIKTERDQVKGDLEKSQASLKELESKLQASETTIKEASELREKLAAYEKEISAVRVEASPEYAKVVTEPASRIRVEADRLAAKYKLDRNKVIDAFAEADLSAQGDIASELAGAMNQRDQFQFYQLVDDFNAVMAKRNELQTKSQDVWQEIQQLRTKTAEADKESSKKNWKAAEEEVWGAIEKRIPLASKLPEITKLREQVVSRPITELTAKEQAYSSMAGLLLPHVVKQSAALEAKIKELETTISKFRTATPGAGGGAPAAEVGSSSDPGMGGFLDNIERRMSGG